MIDSFTGTYFFLSNFSLSPIRVALQPELLGIVDSIDFPTVEHAYQAMKSADFAVQRRVAECPTPGKAKYMGRTLALRSDWEEIKLVVMESLLRAKFEYPELRRLLLDTGDEELVEGNNWGDRFWGKVNGRGENNLGRLLMKIREELK